ncbi:MAG: polymer-forming cytoskeletal protein [Burkholderiaceae bacterium]|jgi:cytoskeletal protein CcmA (bactofilin family)|nr:polymer-forming cytoskeletal protein [Burkholderiaceae bacterium]
MIGIKKPFTVRSVIGAGMQVNGDCVFEGSLEIDGAVLGDVTGQGDHPTALMIGESGRVTGALRADRVVIAGAVAGPVLAHELLELRAGARVQGDVRYKTLEMQQGAVIAGQLQPQMTPPAVPAASKEPTEPTEPTLEPKF